MHKVIDLFAGCGGLSVGFMKAGYNITKAVEFDPVIAETYKLNHPNVEMLVDDIKNISDGSFFKKGDADIIIGGPPCQGFSMAGARIRHDFIDDPRNYLFKHYFKIVKKVKPNIFILENVKGMLTMQQGKIFKEICDIFSDPILLDGQAYSVFSKLIKTVDFGIPQKRERLVIVGVLCQNLPFEDIWQQTVADICERDVNFFNRVTLADAIGNLPQTTSSGVIPAPIPSSDYQKYLSTTADTISNHTHSNHSEKAIARMKAIGNGENYTVLTEKINSVHSGAYGRLCWDEQAPTITTRFDTPAGGRFIHPVENRTISPREAARIQSFPDNFYFQGDKRSISRQIGNAVPPKLAYFLALLAQHILTYIHKKECLYDLP